MEMALHAQLPKTTILAINCCCIAQQALYWSDVSNGWGDQISSAMLSLPLVAWNSSWAWPPEHPTKADWAIWKAFLNNSSCTIWAVLLPLWDPGSIHHTSLMLSHLMHPLTLPPNQVMICTGGYFWHPPPDCIGPFLIPWPHSQPPVILMPCKSQTAIGLTDHPQQHLLMHPKMKGMMKAPVLQSEKQNK